MTRRGFIKRIGGVAASAVAVAALPLLVTHKAQVFDAKDVEIWIGGSGVEGLESSKIIESALIREGSRLDPGMGVPYRFSDKEEWFTVTGLNPPPLKIRNEPRF